MGDASSALSGAAAGAAAGSVVPGWGTAIGAGLGLVGGLMSSDGSAGRAAMSKDAVTQAENEQRYAAMLQALALQRSVAGSEDNFGTKTNYDPYTNTWNAMLGQLPEAAQRASYGANVTRGSVDVPQASYGNQVAAQRESEAGKNVSGASNALASFQPQSEAGVRGSLQEATSRANNETYRPLIADTLRTYARTGSAAGPVLAQLGRSSADSLSKQMAENTARASTLTTQNNSANRGALGDTLKTFVGAGQQGPRNSPGQPAMDPMAAITQSLATRPSTSAQTASLGAYGSPARSNALTNATFGAADSGSAGDFLGGKIAGVGKQVGGLYDIATAGGNGSLANQAMDWFKSFGNSTASYPNGLVAGAP